jgi:hypothetical protein
LVYSTFSKENISQVRSRLSLFLPSSPPSPPLSSDLGLPLRHPQQVNGCPMGRPGQPIEIAAPVIFLASQGASYMTGVTLHINGGMYESLKPFLAHFHPDSSSPALIFSLLSITTDPDPLLPRSTGCLSAQVLSHRSYRRRHEASVAVLKRRSSAHDSRTAKREENQATTCFTSSCFSGGSPSTCSCSSLSKARSKP